MSTIQFKKMPTEMIEMRLQKEVNQTSKPPSDHPSEGWQKTTGMTGKLRRNSHPKDSDVMAFSRTKLVASVTSKKLTSSFSQNSFQSSPKNNRYARSTKISYSVTVPKTTGYHSGVVQLAERLALDQEVGGSSPPPRAVNSHEKS